MPRSAPNDAPFYAELATTTNFSFLRGASHPEELVARARELGLCGLGVADRNSVAGVVRAHAFLRDNQDGDEYADAFRLIVGARLVFEDGAPDILAYPRDRAAWGRLCRLLTRGNLRAEKGACRLGLNDLLEYCEGLQLIATPFSSQPPAEGNAPAQKKIVEALREAANGRVWVAAQMAYGRAMRRDLAARKALAQATGTPLIAINDVMMHTPERRRLADALACIREGVRLDNAGGLLLANAERHLKSPQDMRRLFAAAPEAVEETKRFLDGVAFRLDDLRYEYPDELREGYASQQEALEALAREGARKRWADGIPERINAALEHEFALIAQMNYAAYFLTVHDIVRFARDRGILCQGRGSAANSCVCFCLGVTEVDPTKHDLLFERFISAERKEPPDIDVDFEHERREEVMQYIYARYGQERAGLTATVICYRRRSALREIGKIFGFSDDAIAALTGGAWGPTTPEARREQARTAGFDPQETGLAQALALADELVGFPRHLSQHTGGFVISRARLDEVSPIAPASMEGRTTVEWDKDDLDALGILKIDVLALGMLSALRRGFDLLTDHYGENLTLSTIPSEDPNVYDMICRADTIGVFQIESRAQMSMLPRLKPRVFYDLVIEVAIVRPGPIQGDMVHPYLRRRQGLEQVSFPSPELAAVLGKTLGVALFQEQAMKIAIVAAGFTPAEADKLRRAMATFKRTGAIHVFHAKMVEGMAARGYPRDFAERCFKQIEGFGSYGFPESHAASFALLVYASAWMKCRHPDVFACALLNAQPMGFYAPAQIVRDAREHGVDIRDVDVNFSHWDCTLEDLSDSVETPPIHPRHAQMRGIARTRCALRLGFRQISGLRREDMERLIARRGRGWDSVRDLWLRGGLSPSVLTTLGEADAFRSLGLDRRTALWAVRGLGRAGDKDDLPLFADVDSRMPEPDADLPPMALGEHVVEDYRSLHLSLKAHPVSFLRPRLAARGAVQCADLASRRPSDPSPRRVEGRARIAGLVLVRQRPGTAQGVVFLTLEDETGVANVIVWPKVFERHRAAVVGARLLAVSGAVQNEAGVVHLIAESFEDLSPLLTLLSDQKGFVGQLARADEIRRPQEREKAVGAATSLFDLDAADAANAGLAQTRAALPKGRNFR